MRMRVLIVEDDNFYFEAIELFLKKWQVDYKRAGDFLAAKILLETYAFDMVITDFNFPKGDGDGVLELARKNGVRRVYLNSGLPGQSKNLKSYTGVLSKDDPSSLKRILVGEPS